MVTHNAAAEQALLDQRLAHIPVPAEATADSWSSIRFDDGDAIRALEWSHYDVPGVPGATTHAGVASVAVRGWQAENGEMDRFVQLCDIEDKELSADDARTLAATLTKAADKVDELNNSEAQQ